MPRLFGAQTQQPRGLKRWLVVAAGLFAACATAPQIETNTHAPQTGTQTGAQIAAQSGTQSGTQIATHTDTQIDAQRSGQAMGRTAAQSGDVTQPHDSALSAEPTAASSPGRPSPEISTQKSDLSSTQKSDLPSTQKPEQAALGEAAAAADRAVSLAFVGDIIVGHYHSRGYARHHRPEHAPLAAVAPLLAADLSIANLETPVVAVLPRYSPVESKYRFGATTSVLTLLNQVGISAVSVANNHAADLKEDGLRQTPRLLRDQGITPLGEARVPADGSPFVVQTLRVRGLRVGVVAATTQQNVPLAARPQTPRLPVCDTALLPRYIAPLLRHARAEHDVLIVLLHWGTQFTDLPSPTQRRVAHALVDAGADLVIGHHPHVLQGIERYRHGLIAYSLGNFLFPDASGVPRLTGVLRVDVRRDPVAIAKVTFLPAVARLNAQRAVTPQPATGRAQIEVLSRLHRVSLPLGSRLVQRADHAELPLASPAPPRDTATVASTPQAPATDPPTNAQAGHAPQASPPPS